MHVPSLPGRGGAVELLALSEDFLQLVCLGLLVVQTRVIACLQAPGKWENVITANF